ncbi:MAG: hypothetical protein QNM02_13715 [Acidimicrobiia bacterium]|nr:hypothetical protein [Acidimicrobiia bacterium]
MSTTQPTDAQQTVTAEIQRSAVYVDQVMNQVDALPSVFLQCRTDSPLGRVTMPGIGPITRLFVNRQLGTNLRRMESEIELDALSAGRANEHRGKFAALAGAVGAKSSAVVPILVILGTIGITVSFLSIGVPALQDEADLLGALPKVVSLDGSAIADHASAFDLNPDAFSPRDLQGLFNAALLAGSVLFVLFAVLAGSAHAASAILCAPGAYHTKTPFLDAVRNGPRNAQRAVFGSYPRRLYLPVSMDLVRDGAFWTVVLLAIGANRVREFSETTAGYPVDLVRVGGLEVLWRFMALLFPAVLLAVWLVQRHRRATHGTDTPREMWRVGVGAGLALVAGGALMWSVLLAGDIRVTLGPDLWIHHPEYYLDVDELEEIRSIENVDVQSFSLYGIDLEGENGPIAATLIATELDTIDEFVDVDESELAFAGRRRDERDLRESEPEREVWVSNALREHLNQAPGDEIVLLDGEDSFVLGNATIAFGSLDSDALLLLVDLDELRSWDYDTAEVVFDEVLIDDFMVRASEGPLRDDSSEKRALEELSEEKGYDVLSLRREPVVDSTFLVPLVLVYVVLGMASIWIAFGPVWRPRRADDTDAEPEAPDPAGG